MKLTLTTLNLQAFDDWNAREPAIINYLEDVSPDVILFQEVVFLPEISPHNQAQLLNQQLGYGYEMSTISRLQPSPNHGVYREGLAVLSRYPITSSDTVILQKHPRDEHNRILQMIDVMVDDKPIRLGNVHFSITDTVDFATPHLQETLEILTARQERRLLIGDFNITHLEDTRELWQDAYEASTIVPYITYPTMSKRTDYALIPKEFTFKHISVSEDGLSDHRALTVEIEF